MFKTDINGEVDLSFDVYWRGRKESEPLCMPYYHEPGIMDGGAVVASVFHVIDNNHAVLKVYNCHDSFACDIVEYGITIPIEKSKHYIITWDENGLPVCDQPFEVIDKLYPDPPKENKQSDGFGNVVPEPMMRLVRLAMPQTVRNKIFTEFPKDVPEGSVTYSVEYTKKDFVDKILNPDNIMPGAIKTGEEHL